MEIIKNHFGTGCQVFLANPRGWVAVIALEKDSSGMINIKHLSHL